MTTPPPNSPGSLNERIQALIWRKPATTVAERARRRIVLHLIPFLFFLYILAYLDRVNIAVAKLGMETPAEDGGLGFPNDVIGFGFGLFFIGYWILEIPSTVWVVRWGARWVFVRILVLWGVCAALVGFIGTPFASSLFAWLPHLSEPAGPPLLAEAVRFVNDLPHSPRHQYYFFRFMLGFFEGGFFPSVIVYFSFWFRASDRAKAIAGFMSAIPFSNIVGNPISGLLLDVHWFGLQGWRWVFILEGIAPILAGVATLFLLPDRPATAKWLPPDERAWILAELEREKQTRASHGHWDWLRDRRNLLVIVLLTMVYFSLNFTSYGLGSFMPTIIKRQAQTSNNLLASCLAALPYVMALIAMQINGRHSDRTGERLWHAGVPLTLWGVGLLLAWQVNDLPIVPIAVMILLVGPFLYAHLPAFWPLPTMFLGATTAASAIGFINMLGNIGGFFGSNEVGELAAQQRYATALLILAPGPLLSAAIILMVGYVRRPNKGVRDEKRP